MHYRSNTRPALASSLASPLALGLLLASTGLGCGGGALESSFVAVHHSMSSMNLSQVGATQRGKLKKGAQASHSMKLERGKCYVVVGLGGKGVENLDILIQDSDGNTVARDNTYDAYSSAKWCTQKNVDSKIVVGMAAGAGQYVLSVWTRAQGDGDSAGSAGGTCASPVELELGTSVSGNTTGAQSSTQGSCGQAAAPEHVYQVTVEERSQLRAVLQSQYDGMLYIMSECGGTELACNDDSPNATRSEVRTTVEPGTYFVVVDGFNQASGAYELVVSASPMQAVVAVCGEAKALQWGQPESASTQGATDDFAASCAGGAHSPDHVYSMEVTERSRVRVHQRSDYDSALHLRSTCEDSTSEIACNDDSVDQQHSAITTVLDPGTYYVFSDGFQTDNSGNYTLQADQAPEGGGDGAGNSCSNAVELDLNDWADVDTFALQDSLAGSCGGGDSSDQVFQFNTRKKVRARIEVEKAQFAGALYVRSKGCANAEDEALCINWSQGESTFVETVLEKGNHFVAVDGDEGGDIDFGQGRLRVSTTDFEKLSQVCSDARKVEGGDRIAGNTASSDDTFHASCAGNTKSRDDVYQLVLENRSNVTIELSGDFDTALHLRSSCMESTDEIACNDDAEEGERNAKIETTLEAGTYYIIADGFQEDQHGSYSLRVDVTER